MTASAQKFMSDTKGSVFGVGFDVVDFVTPTRIMNSNLGHVINHGEWAKWPAYDVGWSAMYWKGLTSRLDLSLQYNGIYVRHLKIYSEQYVNELEGAFRLRALKDDHLFNPFLTAGIGAGYYGWKMAAYTPLGIGLQTNIRSRVYLFIQANYRLSLARNVIDDNLFYSAGVAFNFSKRHRKLPAPAPAPVVINYDHDNDGVPDSVDACPDVAGLPALHGCPDRDGDGIADKDDRCPNQAGLPRYNGCPIPDSDGDGINDEVDKCPHQAGVAKYNGCPIPDSDGDGVNDEEDKCPGVAGPASNHGCPEVKQEQIEKAKYAARHIFFASGKAALLKKSFASLNEIAVLMEANPTLRLEIDGYTDNTGTAQRNLVLSQSRAEAVMAYLEKRGVDESRMAATGHGEENPVADNKTAAGRAKNRRVELQLKAY